MILRTIAVLAITFFFVPQAASAALLYLDPQEGEYGLGDMFMVHVRIDNEGECINAAEIRIKYPTETLQAVDFSRGDSILSLWIEEPNIDTKLGTIDFSGGIPGGYCGRIQGDPALSNSLGKIVFSVPDGAVFDDTTITIDSRSRVFLNDGQGTEVQPKTQEAVFSIVSFPVMSQNEWLREVEEDDTLPESFVVWVESDPSVFGGRYYAVFSTTDKQSGLSHFEILEHGVWKRVKSPYQLRDQALFGGVRVRAIDKAGNARMGEFDPEAVPPRQVPWSDLLLLLGTFGTILALGIGKLFFDRRSDRRSSASEQSE